MNILITGVTGFRNRGVDALVTPLIQFLSDRVDGAKITIATCSPEYDQKRIEKLGAVNLVLDGYSIYGRWAPPLALSLKQRVLNRILSKIGVSRTSKLQDSRTQKLPYKIPDLIIVTGGDIISSDYGTDSLNHVLQPIKWAKDLRIPCVLLGQSIGIFKSDEHLQIWKEVQNDITLITAREPITYDYLTSKLSCSTDKVHLTTDIAFLLEASESARLAFKHDNSFPLIAVAPSNLISRYSRANSLQRISAWVHLIKRFLNSYGAKILLVPHVHEQSYNDDRIIVDDIWRGLDYDNRVTVLASDLSASEYKGIISSCDMVLAERMHAAIAGFSSQVCTIPVSYSIKAQGLTSQIYNSSPYNVSDVCLSVDELLNLDYSIPHIDRLWYERLKHVSIIQAQAAETQRLAKLNLDLLDNVLSNVAQRKAARNLQS